MGGSFTVAEAAQFQTYIAERHRVRIGLMSSPMAVLQRADVQVEAEDYGNRLGIIMESWVHAMPGKRIKVHCEWPCNWWQALRDRWFPKWWLERYPVEVTIIDLDEVQYLAVCPHIQDEGQKVHLKWMASEFEGRNEPPADKKDS